MKKFIGGAMTKAGAKLWYNGGWTGAESYDDLKVTGKLGFRMFCKGLDMLNITPDMVEEALRG